VRQRQARPSLLLSQQWVHRRGVHDLQRFCRTELGSALGPEAVIWLQELLSLDTPIQPAAASPSAQPEASPASEASFSETAGGIGNLQDLRAVAHSDGEGLSKTAGTLPSAGTGDGSEPPLATLVPPAEQPGQDQPAPEQELDDWAVAAVDEAFAALAQSFQQGGDPAVGTPAPLAAGTEPPSASDVLPAPEKAPEPLPVRGGLWPSLRASAAGLTAALRPDSAAEPSSPGPDLQGQASPSLSEEPPSISGTVLTAEATSTEPTHSEAASSAEAPASLTSALNRADALPSQPEEPVEGAGDTSDNPAAEPTPQVGLLRRLRGRIETGGLSRLRAVMRDCVEETVALLRTPEHEHGNDVGPFDASQLQEPAEPIAEPPAFSWTLESFQAPSPAPAASAQPSPTEPEQAPMPEADRRVSMPTPPTRSSRLRFGLPVARPLSDDDQPAPTPAGLSDLQAWLPDRGDLPRAS
jgi:hypothetical protein